MIYQVFEDDLFIFLDRRKFAWYKKYYSIVSPKTEKEKAYKTWGIAGYSVC